LTSERSSIFPSLMKRIRIVGYSNFENALFSNIQPNMKEAERVNESCIRGCKVDSDKTKRTVDRSFDLCFSQRQFLLSKNISGLRGDMIILGKDCIHDEKLTKIGT
jgi:hypothetical protein